MDGELLQDSDGVNESVWDGQGVEIEVRYFWYGSWGCGGFRWIENFSRIRMVLTRASGMDLASSLKRNTFWTAQTGGRQGIPPTRPHKRPPLPNPANPGVASFWVPEKLDGVIKRPAGDQFASTRGGGMVSPCPNHSKLYFKVAFRAKPLANAKPPKSSPLTLH